MKLGLSQASYRWICYPWLRYDTPEYLYSERRLPYHNTIQPPPTLEAPIAWLLERITAHDFTSLYMDSGWLADEAGAAAFKRRCAELGLTYFAAATANLAAEPDDWGSPRYDRAARAAAAPVYRVAVRGAGWTSGTEFQQAVRAMELAAAAGARAVNVVHREAGRLHRFTKDPPLARQLDNVIRNMRSLVPVAEALGLTMTNESHMDYRVADFMQVRAAVASPWLLHCFDFANSISVVEDPLDAAQLAAPYTLFTHIKDMRVQPAVLLGEPMFFHTPIGLGHVPVEAILDVLQAHAPDPASLHHCVEVPTMPEFDPEQWLAASVQWLRSNCGRFWT
ncbi:MAG: sugar phosphate isomerase/epimerase [Actinobacteria bacterium]|nr:sugar phosphate isomerase/epimerase [Actinomycetota bacterium]